MCTRARGISLCTYLLMRKNCGFTSVALTLSSRTFKSPLRSWKGSGAETRLEVCNTLVSCSQTLSAEVRESGYARLATSQGKENIDVHI